MSKVIATLLRRPANHQYSVIVVGVHEGSARPRNSNGFDGVSLCSGTIPEPLSHEKVALATLART
jgi:hypothetical protein